MNKRILFICIVILHLLSTESFARTSDDDPTIITRVTRSFAYQALWIKNIALIKTFPDKPERLLAKRIDLYIVDRQPNLAENRISRLIHPHIITNKKLIWSITAKNLPVTNEICREVDSLLCDEYLPDGYNDPACYSPCIAYGPEFINYNERIGNLYISSQTETGGNSSWPLLIFVVNINTKRNQVSYCC